MILMEEAHRRIGAKVVYRPGHVSQREPGEEGVITSVGMAHVFVRYGSDRTSKATRPTDLEFVT